MQQEKENVLEAIRSPIAYYTCDFQKGSGYEKMWRRMLDIDDSFKAISIMDTYVEFDKAHFPAAALGGGRLRGGVHV